MRLAGEHDIGDALGRVGSGELPAPPSPSAGGAPDPSLSVEHDAQLVRERVALRQQHGRVAFDQIFGIARLVVVDRQRERHQHAADAGGAQFGQRQRTARQTTKSAHAYAAAMSAMKGSTLGGDAGMGIRAVRHPRAASRRTGGALRAVSAQRLQRLGTAG